MPRSRLAGSGRQNRRHRLFRGQVPIPWAWGHLAARCPHMSPLRSDPFGLPEHVPDTGSAHPLDQGYPARRSLTSIACSGDTFRSLRASGTCPRCLTPQAFIKLYVVRLTRCSAPRNDGKPIVPISRPVRAAGSAGAEGRNRRCPRSGWADGGAVWRIQPPPACRGSNATRT
jgi:hypothetical protein